MCEAISGEIQSSCDWFWPPLPCCGALYVVETVMIHREMVKEPEEVNRAPETSMIRGSSSSLIVASCCQLRARKPRICQDLGVGLKRG